ncbi:MAG: ParB/RepB/Spo0J family partition protein [Oscillospiraceae bacterium]
MKNKIDLSSIKKVPLGNDTQFNKDTPMDLVESYTSTWGSTTEKVEEISLNFLEPFELNGSKQPFNINQDKINQIKLSAKDIGIITPLIVRKLENNRYQIVSGHHRFLVAKELGLLSVPCIVRNISDDVIYKYVTESNIQRVKVYPSEYGRIFLKYMEIRHDIDITAQEIADKFGLSKKTMYRYINVTKLIYELQNFTDNGLISLDAVDVISQFSKENQEVVCDYLTQTNKKIMVSLAKKMDKFIKENGYITISNILYLVQPKEKDKYKNKIYNILSKDYDLNYTEEELDNLVLKLLNNYFKDK